MIRALIFDCDGTLADTMPLHYRAWQVLMRRHHFDLPEARFYALGGVPTREILHRLKRDQGLPLDPLAVAKEKEEEMLKLLSEVTPIEPIVEVARQHRERLPMAVASSGSRRIIELILGRLEIRPWFAAVVTQEDVSRHKPAPDIFLEAARRLGVAPEHCVAYEDTDLGLEAVRVAGMQAVDVREVLNGKHVPGH